MPARSLRFLVVEDHEFQRAGMVLLLRGMGAAAVHEAEDGRAALRVLRDPDRPVDIVVTDLSMPGMDGMEFVRHLSEAGTRVSLILASALQPELLASIANMAQAYKVKLLGVIGKPLSAAKVAPLLALHRSMEPGPQVTDVAFPLGEIADAWTKNEFEAWYVPKVSVRDSRVCGVRGTARWRHPTRGLLEPAAFMPSVAAHGLNDDVAWMMLHKAAADCRRWRDEGLDLTVSVHLSLRTLSDMDLANRVRLVAQRAGVEPGRIILGVRETAINATDARALENLARLRVDGFGLAIRDFGSGPLAVDELSLVAFTEIHIRSAYVTAVERQGPARAGLAVALDFGQRHKMQAVAEGVRSKGEWKVLKEWGCHFAEGPLISSPLPADEVAGWTRSWPGDPIR